MSLLSEIVDGVDTMPVATLLRKVTILARRLQSDPLTEWVHHELTGYKEDSNIPDYRGPFPATVQGNFILPFTSEASRLEIAPIGFPEDQRDTNWFKLILIQPIAEIEAATADGQPREFQIPWSADYVKYVNYLMQQGQVRLYTGALLLNAWRSVSGLQLRGIVDAVRTRLLNFALAMEEIEPTAGDPGATAPPPAVVTTVVNNYIFDSTVNLAQASEKVAQTMITRAATDPGTSQKGTAQES